ncbi:hypothetical protein K470DRAFT_213523 [Piedraia hortae CBS 480.64]|uniref:rhomboid protease n=1 Tax=Piedraia hortae CBS 480.64 TaxID=1314780 RepID=A0A6A7C4A9_9PEZI|nr:hypothetical protein K470DRAFT_213523 [Piedraia hortae CBS 480.64]
MAAVNLPDARRLKSYLFRIPLATRLIILLITVFYIATVFVPWLRQWGALVPHEISLSTLYRLNTFPLLHRDFVHFLSNILVLVPLLDRFEQEHGTMVTLALFTGQFGLLPGGLYTLLERHVFRLDSSAIGASVWVFLLLSYEAVRTSKTHPHLVIMNYKIPTWITPLAPLLLISFLIPHSSFLGHSCGAVVGYVWGLGYIRFLAPPDKVLRWLEARLNLLGRLPRYVSVDQKTYGRYGVLPTSSNGRPGTANGSKPGQRLGLDV